MAILMTSGHLLHDKEEPGVTTLQQAVLSIFSLFFNSYRWKYLFFYKQARDSAYFIDKEERLQIRLTGEVQKRILISQNYSCAIKDAR